MKTKESMVSDLENEMDDEMSKSGVYSQGIEGMMAASEFKNSLGEENEIDEKWSKKYKDSIDCKNPKGFSQKAHCQGKNKKTETDESTGSGSAGGFSAPLFSTTKKEMGEDCWKGYKAIGGKMKNGKMVPNCIKESKEEYCDSCDRVKSKCVCGEKKTKEKKYLDIEDMIPELRKQLNKGTRLDKDTKKVEATEATGSGSSGQYSTTAAWAKSTSKKDWMGKSKPQIPGGKFVQVKKKCKKFPYCNQGDIKALKIYENDTVKKAIKNISEKHNISENVIKSIISYEYEKLKSNK
jgi:hypothetical protein